MMRSQCPAHYDKSLPGCSSARPEQRPVSAEELRKAGVNEEWVTRARRCSYCKCVYSVEASYGYKDVRGRLENGVWTPFVL